MLDGGIFRAWEGVLPEAKFHSALRQPSFNLVPIPEKRKHRIGFIPIGVSRFHVSLTFACEGPQDFKMKSLKIS